MFAGNLSPYPWLRDPISILKCRLLSEVFIKYLGTFVHRLNNNKIDEKDQVSSENQAIDANQ